MSKLRLLRQAEDASKAWVSETELVFGAKDAAMARYEGRAAGSPGSPMRDLYERYRKAKSAYEAECNAIESTPKGRRL